MAGGNLAERPFLYFIFYENQEISQNKYAEYVDLYNELTYLLQYLLLYFTEID